MPSPLLDTASQDVLRVAYLLIRMYAVLGMFKAFLILARCCIQRHSLLCCCHFVIAKDILRKELAIVQARILDETRPRPTAQQLQLLWNSAPGLGSLINELKSDEMGTPKMQLISNCQNHGQFFSRPTHVTMRRCARKELNTICGSLTGWNSSTLAVVAGGSDNLFTRGTGDPSLQKRVVFWHLGWNCIFGISKAMALDSRPLCLHLAWPRCCLSGTMLPRLISHTKRWKHGKRHPKKTELIWSVAVWSWGFWAIGWSRWAYDRQPSGAQHESDFPCFTSQVQTVCNGF